MTALNSVQEMFKVVEILFVCTGNTCRSPMAEGLFNVYAEKHGIDAHAFSRGLFAEGGPASKNAVTAAAEFGADISGHVSRSLERADIERAARVYCMGASHLATIREMFPEFSEKVGLLAPGGGIADPYGMDLESYRKTAMQIAENVVRIANSLKNDAGNEASGDKNGD